jgi:hypothetical protein
VCLVVVLSVGVYVVPLACDRMIFGSLVLNYVGVSLQSINGEFDPGSGRTLAACLTHASRADLRVSGERVSNTWATCPRLWNNSGKPGLMPDIHTSGHLVVWKDLLAWDGPAAYQLVGGVMAHQGDDG